MDRRQFIQVAMGGAAAMMLSRTGATAFADTEPPPVWDGPLNVVVILADDADYGMGQYAMPRTRARMAVDPHWTEFTQAFCNQAICAPSRASLLTGRYPHQHGVTDNRRHGKLDGTQTLATWLKAADYRTGMYGKYLWGARPPKGVPGWDVFEGGDRSDSVAADAVHFIENSDGRPWFLLLMGKDPHKPPRPPARYKNVEVEMAPLPPMETDLSDKPAWVRKRPGGNGGFKQRIGCYRAMLAFDDMVDRIVVQLETTGQLDRTLIIVTSDHGFSWGSNGVGGKNAPYDPSIHVPMLVYDPQAPGVGTCGRVVSMVDVTATILARTGVLATLPQMGQDVTPLMRGEDVIWRDAALIEGHEDRRRKKDTWRGVRTPLITYVETSDGFVELYDLVNDPWQHENVAGLPEYEATVATAAEWVAVELTR